MGKDFGGFATYQAYLESPHWKRMRSHFCGPMARCYACDTPSRLQIHHTCYDHLGKERSSDFIVVCRDCHERIHDALRAKFPWKSLSFQVDRTDHVFPAIFARTLAQACQRYRHHDRWGDFMLGGRQPPTKAKATPPKAPKDPKPKTEKKKKKRNDGCGQHRGKKAWLRIREAKRHEDFLSQTALREQQFQLLESERRERLGPDEYKIFKLPTLQQRILARIELRQRTT